MEEQTSIYDIPHARVGDPSTSQQSARKTEAAEGTTTVLRPNTQKHLALATIAGRARTSAQVVKATGKPGIWKRVSDLKNAELIYSAGEVFDTDTDRHVTLWDVTLKGHRVLAVLDRGETVKL